jgi:putative hydrolase of the HAD superfamily
MVEAVATLSSNGIQTALVSNSWGPVDGYPWAHLPTFTQVVVSSEVGIRKPDPAVYRLAADRLQRKSPTAFSSATSRSTWPQPG